MVSHLISLLQHSRVCHIKRYLNRTFYVPTMHITYTRNEIYNKEYTIYKKWQLTNNRKHIKYCKKVNNNLRSV